MIRVKEKFGSSQQGSLFGKHFSGKLAVMGEVGDRRIIFFGLLHLMQRGVVNEGGCVLKIIWAGNE